MMLTKKKSLFKMFEQTCEALDPISTFQVSSVPANETKSRGRVFLPWRSLAAETSRNVHLILIASAEVRAASGRLNSPWTPADEFFNNAAESLISNWNARCRGWRTVNSDLRVAARRGTKRRGKKGTKTRMNAKFFRVKGFRCPRLYFPGRTDVNREVELSLGERRCVLYVFWLRYADWTFLRVCGKLNECKNSHVALEHSDL